MSTTPSTNGRFAPGNKASKGNPRIKRLAENHGALLDCFTQEEVKALARRLFDLCINDGDRKAGMYLLDRLCGKLVETPLDDVESSDRPAQVVLLDWRLSPAKAVELLATTEAGDTTAVCELMRQHAGV